MEEREVCSYQQVHRITLNCMYQQQFLLRGTEMKVEEGAKKVTSTSAFKKVLENKSVNKKLLNFIRK